jgi:hypothetical protein
VDTGSEVSVTALPKFRHGGPFPGADEPIYTFEVTFRSMAELHPGEIAVD